MSSPAALTAARQRYAGNAVTTASGPTLLVMLYDRLVRDLLQAEQALGRRDFAQANSTLQHAQQIVLELRTSLQPAGWSGGAGLLQLYTYLHAELVTANMEKDAEHVVTCRQLVEPLRDAWRQAAADAESP